MIKGHGSCTITHLEKELRRLICIACVAVIVCTWLHQDGLYPPTQAQYEADHLWRALQSPPKAAARPPRNHHCKIHLYGPSYEDLRPSHHCESSVELPRSRCGTNQCNVGPRQPLTHRRGRAANHQTTSHFHLFTTHMYHLTIASLL